MLTLRQLHYFAILSRHMHFGKAADECAVSQPALSMQIKELETTLGVPLIERNKTGIRLTTDGETILERTREVLRSVQDLKDSVHHKDRLLCGKLVLGVIPTIAPYLLPKALPHLKTQYPDLQLKLRESQTARLIEELLQGRLDAVLLALPEEADGVTSRELFVDHFLLAAKVSDSGTDPYQVMAEQDLLLLEEGHCLRDQILAFCRKHKPDALSSYSATSLSTITQLIANGFGATLLPEIARDIELNKQNDITLLKFPDPQPQRTIGLMWRSSSPREADYQALGDILKSVSEEIFQVS